MELYCFPLHVYRNVFMRYISIKKCNSSIIGYSAGDNKDTVCISGIVLHLAILFGYQRREKRNGSNF